MDIQTGPKNGISNHDKSRILLVDDDKDVLALAKESLEWRGFEVVATGTVKDALRLISNETFDVLMADLHMPNVGDGFTVVSAMRHVQPKTVTLLVSGYPAIQESMNAIVLQADEVVLKTAGLEKITEIINRRLSSREGRAMVNKERVASILDSESAVLIQSWLSRVQDVDELIAVKLSPEERTGYLPRLVADLSFRLRGISSDQIRASSAAHEDGVLRRTQGYTIAMMVEESRILQVSIFNMLQNNLPKVDFDTVLLDVMTIADEVDSQLKQAVLGFTESATPNTVPAIA